MNKGFQAIAAEVTDYSKKAFEDSTRAFEQLIGAKTIEQAIEIQSQYAKKAYDGYVAETYESRAAADDAAAHPDLPAAFARAGVVFTSMQVDFLDEVESGTHDTG